MEPDMPPRRSAHGVAVALFLGVILLGGCVGSPAGSDEGGAHGLLSEASVKSAVEGLNDADSHVVDISVNRLADVAAADPWLLVPYLLDERWTGVVSLGKTGTTIGHFGPWPVWKVMDRLLCRQFGAVRHESAAVAVEYWRTHLPGKW